MGQRYVKKLYCRNCPRNNEAEHCDIPKTKNKPNENRELNPEDNKVFDKIVDLFDGEILH